MKALFFLVALLATMLGYGQVMVFEISYNAGSSNKGFCTHNNFSANITDVGSYSISEQNNYVGNSVIVAEIPAVDNWRAKITAIGWFNGGNQCNGYSATIGTGEIDYTLNAPCKSYSWTAGDSDYRVTIQLNIYTKPGSIGGTAPGNYCSNAIIELVPNNGFSSHIWQYQIQGGTWTNFSPNVCGLNSRICFTLQDLVGANNVVTNLIKPVYFRYWTGATCDPSKSALATGAYTFYAPPPSFTATPSAPICPNGSGSISIAVTSPIPGASYIYSKRQNVAFGWVSNAITAATNSSFVDPPGSYEVAVEVDSDSIVSCPAFKTIVIPPAPTFSINVGNLIAPSCTGGNDGQVPITTTNGVSPFTWSLDTPNPTNGFTSQPYTASGTAGSHTLRVRDNCQTIATANIDIPSTTTALSANVILNHPTCNGNGSISITTTQVGSYASNYAYALAVPGNSGQSVNDDLTASFSTLWDNLNYQLNITSPNGCLYTTNIDLNPPPSISGTFTPENVSCYGGNDGVMTFAKNTGSDQLSFFVDGQTVIPSSSEDATYVFPGYTTSPETGRTLRVVDNCLTNTGASTKFVQSSLIINQPSAPMSFASGANLIGNGQILPIACAGGTTNAMIAVQHAVGATTTSLVRKANAADMTGVSVPSPDNAPFALVNLVPGFYEFQVQDDCHSINMAFQVIAPALPVQADVTKSVLNFPYHLACNESANGELAVVVSGGVPGLGPAYQIELLDQNSNPSGTISSGTAVTGGVAYTITGLRANVNYALRVSDYNNNGAGSCTQTFNVGFFSAPPPLTIDNIDHNDLVNEVFHNGQIFVQCHDQSNINLVAGVSGGNAPYNVTLQTNSTNAWPANIFATSYNIGDNTAEFNGLGANFYQASVEDQRGCSSTPRQFRIGEAAAPIQVNNIMPSLYGHGGNTVCHGDANASITISGSGGVQPYTYRLQADDGNPDRMVNNLENNNYQFTALPAITADETQITYTVHFQDVLGCVWPATNGVERSVTMIAPDPVTMQFEIVSRTQGIYEIPCHGDLAELSVSSHGGQYPHEILITNINNASLIYPGQISSSGASISFSLPAGLYSVAVVDDLGCSAPTQNITIDEPVTHVQLFPGMIVPPACIGGNNGSISVSATNGIQGSIGEEYRFVVRKIGNTEFDSDTIIGTSAEFIRPADFYNAQDYEVNAIDFHGCIDSQVISLPANPAPLTLTSLSNISPSCYGGNNGTIQVRVSNYHLTSGEPFRFLISGGHFGSAISETTSFDDTFTFEHLEGTDTENNFPYSIWVEDSHHCADTASQYLASEQLPSYLPVAINLTESIRPTCFNADDGLLSVSVSGGVAPYLYSLNNVDFSPVDPTGLVVFENRLAGDHTVYIRDANFEEDQPACLVFEVFSVDAGRFLNLITSVQPVHCKNENDGSIDLTVDIQNTDVNEEIDPLSFSYAWVHNNVSSVPTSNEQDISSLFAGTYTVSVRYETLGCQNQKTINVSEPITEFHIADVKIFETTCGHDNDGRAVITVAGGWQNEPVYYRLDQANWRLFSGNSFVLSGLAAGEHSVSIAQRDYECLDIVNFSVGTTKLDLVVDTVLPPGCPDAADGQIFLSAGIDDSFFAQVGGEFQPSGHFAGLNEGTYRFVARRITNENCSSDTIQVFINDPVDCGNGPLFATTTNVVATTCSSVADGSATLITSGGVPPYQYQVDGISSSALLTGLTAGNHSVTVSDQAGSNFEITFTIPSLPAIQVYENIKMSNCAGSCDGRIEVVPAGGSDGYLIQWLDGDNSAVRENICAGQYEVKVADARNPECATSQLLTVGVMPAATVELIQTTAPTCAGDKNGKLFLEIKNGSGDFQFIWSNGNEEKNLINVEAGEYTLNFIDAGWGCTSYHTFTIPDAAPIQVEHDITPPKCFGGSDGMIRLSLPNSTAPLVTWSNSMIGVDILGISAGNYDYTILDSKGCTFSGTIQVEDRPQLTVAETVIQPGCWNSSDGKIDLEIEGGSAPFTVNWMHGPKQTMTKNLFAGNYSYFVKDRFGCSFSNTVKVDAPSSIQIDADVLNPTCYAGTNGAISLKTSGGTGEHSVAWQSPVSNSRSISGLKKGSYNVVVEDTNECVASAVFVLTDPAPLSIRVDRLQHPLCNYSADGSIEIGGAGGTIPYSMVWNDFDNSLKRNNLPGGSYEVELTDKNLCKTKKHITLVSPEAMLVTNEIVTNPFCFDESTGSIQITTIGGILPYEYQWNNVSGAAFQNQLVAGTYHLNVADKNNCEVTRTYELINPDQLFVTGIPNSSVLCEGGTLLLSPAESWTNYLWTGPNQFKSEEPSIVTGVHGVYNLKVLDHAGCPAEVQFSVDVSNNPIDSDFLILSEAVIFEPIIFVDITLPEPESIEWLIPEDPDVIVNKKSSGMIELIFTRSDDFEIGFTANLGTCVSTLTKSIVIQQTATPTENSQGRTKVQAATEPDVTIFPNPVTSRIYLAIETPTEDDVILKLFTLSGNHLIYSEILSGSTTYTLELDLPQLSTGVHTLLYEYHNKIYSKKIVVMR